MTSEQHPAGSCAVATVPHPGSTCPLATFTKDFSPSRWCIVRELRGGQGRFPNTCSVKLLLCSVIAPNNITSITSAVQVASDTTMSLVELCQEGDLEEVKAALKSGADVNTKDKYGWTGLMRAVTMSNVPPNHNSVVALLLR